MLILTRKIEQGIVIDGQVVVRVLAIDGERIKLGIEAPRAISVLREELLHEVVGQNRAAAAGPGHTELTAALRHLGA
ncbi:MAG: carbon storage regulator [Dehalococcoidia bacterium]|nr:MAG: carbon storage regulator [Dehalococcoidia bacterium]